MLRSLDNHVTQWVLLIILIIIACMVLQIVFEITGVPFEQWPSVLKGLFNYLALFIGKVVHNKIMDNRRVESRLIVTKISFICEIGSLLFLVTAATIRN